METNQINQSEENAQDEARHNEARKHIYKFILTPFSFESSNHFNKIHKRKFNSFGCIHQMGKLPGSML